MRFLYRNFFFSTRFPSHSTYLPTLVMLLFISVSPKKKARLQNEESASSRIVSSFLYIFPPIWFFFFLFSLVGFGICLASWILGGFLEMGQALVYLPWTFFFLFLFFLCFPFMAKPNHDGPPVLLSLWQFTILTPSPWSEAFSAPSSTKTYHLSTFE